MKFRDYIFENTIKSFDKHLLNEDYMRFLKKNPNLTPDQREKINKFYTGKGAQHAVKEFEREIGWQSKRVKEMTWDDFAKIMKSSKAGQRELLQSTEIPGSKGKDYWPIKLKTKDYIANIPLNFKTAKYMNSCEYGTINVNYCIGSDEYKDKYWKFHVLKEQKVPIYITDGKGKWVVMIKPGNKDYEVWDKLNKKDIAITNKEPIPDFSIKKELLSSGLKKLYYELREKFFVFEHWIAKAETKNADYKVNSNGDVHWYNGTWIKGTWENGVWKGGTWEKGTWEKGIWKGGTWEKGTWKGGRWEKGTWKKGTWVWGTWEKGTWEDGTWEYGRWKGGTWEKGTWKAGHFMLPSIWEKGTWEKGTWEGGIWKDGTWEKGTWKDGTWEWGTWEKGTWEKGTWKGGTWLGGTWEKGTWKGGFDKDENYHPEGDSPDKWNK